MEYIDQDKNSDVYEFIKRNPCAVLSTIDADGDVDLAHIFVFIDLAFNLYFHSKIDTRKIENIEKKGRVAMLFADRDALQQAEFKGHATILTDAKDILTYFPKIQEVIASRKSEYWSPPAAQVPGDGYAIVKITPGNILYRDYSREKRRGTT